MDTTVKTSLVADAKLRLRLHINSFDSEIGDLVEGAAADLMKRNAIQEEQLAALPIDPLIKRAIMTYVRAYFGTPEDAERLKSDYDEQKATLMTTSGFTNWEA